MELVAFDRYKDFAARVVVSSDQRINVIRGQLDLGRLTCARLLLEILPPFADALNLVVRSGEFRHGHGRFRDRMRFRQPINAMHYCRVPLKPPIHASNTSDREHDRKHQKNKTTSGETAQSLSSRRRLNPAIHVFRRCCASILDCASSNLSYSTRKPSESVRVPAIIGMKLVS